MEGQPGAALRPVVWTERTVVELWGKLKWTIKHHTNLLNEVLYSCVISLECGSALFHTNFTVDSDISDAAKHISVVEFIALFECKFWPTFLISIF